jgi:hypothetical protein
VVAQGARAAGADPYAHAAGINSVVPVFYIRFGYNVLGPGRLELLWLKISPFYKAFETWAGGCTKCGGPGNFGSARIRGHTWEEKVVGGKVFMTSSTRIAQSVTSPNEIGRFKVYGLSLSGTPAPVVLASGCTPANLFLTNSEVFHWRTLPTVPCTAKVPRNDHLTVRTPAELSSTSSEQGTISGHATGEQWLIAFEAQHYKSCAPNAFAEDLITNTFFEQRVRGNFLVNFQTAPATTPGYICAYLQKGGRIRVTSGAELPYGRVSAAANWAFLAGDTVSISAPPSASPGQSVSVTATGTASVNEQLYLFSPFSPCAGTAQAEYGEDPDNFTTAETAGPFSTTATLTISPNAPPTVYVCAYLQLGAPSNGVPTGPTLATASQTISVQ